MIHPADHDRSGVWSELASTSLDASSWDRMPVALLVLDAERRPVAMNKSARLLLHYGDGNDNTAIAAESVPPFETRASGPVDVGEMGEEVERVASWRLSPDEIREFAYRTTRSGRGTLVAFRDVTDLHRRQRRVAAVARTAARVASERSLPRTLNAMAREILEINELAGVQILTSDSGGTDLHVMGSAGFAPSENFFELLIQCKQRGASLKMLDAFTTGRHVVVHDRYDSIMADPAWEPLKGYLRRPRWGSFASIALLVRGSSVGVLNAFFSPGQTVGLEAMDFLSAMAEQASLAVDYAAMMERERTAARRSERQRMARDLHDSVVQQVFSISMQTQTLKALSARAETIDSTTVSSVVEELEDLARTALRDMRSLISELHPSVPTEHGLGSALDTLAADTGRRSTLVVDLQIAAAAYTLAGELAEDAYLIVAEAVHNAVKHSGGERVCIRADVSSSPEPGVHLCVTDDGVGLQVRPALGTEPRTQPGGYGLTSMRERAESIGGYVRFETSTAGGASVSAYLPRVRHSSRSQ